MGRNYGFELFRALFQKIEDYLTDSVVASGKHHLEKLDSKRYSREYEEIIGIYRKQNLPEPNVLLEDGKYASAATLPSGRTVIVSQGLLDLNSEIGAVFKQEHGKGFLEHVFAHEIGHLGFPKLDVAFSIFLVTVGCYTLSKFRPFRNLAKSENNLVNIVSEFMLSALSINYLVRIPTNLFKMQSEFHADKVASELTSPEGLISVYEAILENNRHLRDASPEQHEYPNTIKSIQSVVKRIFTPVRDHPTASERIKRLERMSQDSKSINLTLP